MRRFSALFFALLLPFSSVAQTLTATDNAGETVVEVITVDPNGLPTTSTISTILPVPATTTVTTIDAAGETVVEVINGDGVGDSTTQTIQTIPPVDPNQGQGPVGQPGPTGGAGLPTPFTYTTTDANGDTLNVVATFTPSIATFPPPSATFKATVLGYSQYTASYATQVPVQNNNQNGAVRRSSGWWGPCLSLVISVVGGVVLLRGA